MQKDIGRAIFYTNQFSDRNLMKLQNVIVANQRITFFFLLSISMVYKRMSSYLILLLFQKKNYKNKHRKTLINCKSFYHPVLIKKLLDFYIKRLQYIL